MTAPNIVSINTLTAKSTGFSLSDTNATVILSNTASSGKVYKVNGIIAANDNGTSSADVTLSLHPVQGGGGTPVHLAYTITIPPDTSVVLLDKAFGLYLEEDKSLSVVASAANYIDVAVSWEEIS